MKKSLIIAILAMAVCAASGFAATNTTTTQCAEMWRKAKAQNKTGTQTWPEYLSKCSDKIAKTEAKQEKAEAKSPKKATTTTKTKSQTRNADNPTPAQKAMYKRMRKCGEMWRELKAKGKEGNQTWPEYWDKCSDRLKAQQ